MAQQQLSVVTLGVADIPRSRLFYVDGFGWTPVFEQDEIIFYQMNGFVLGTWLKTALAEDQQRALADDPTAFALAHNVPTEADVDPLMAQLAAAGGTVVRPADAPPHGGRRGYVGDPDAHTWEIAWNPAWTIDAHGHVTFGV